jgi:motility quorum-sensing regulator/GCU-specific mRNA interferase toxin
MEKSKPHYELDRVKGLIRAGHYRLTRVAFEGGGQLGFKTGEEIAEFVLTLKNADFYKSMTSNQNHKEWQDVYHGQAPEGRTVYLKFIVINDVLILSFKEK